MRPACDAAAGADHLGDLLADDIIARLSHLPQLRVISRLSTAAFRGRPSSAWHAYREEGGQAVASALRAQSLSPLGPVKYYYDNFTSTAVLSAGWAAAL